MVYDGTTPLQPVIAKLIGCSPKSQVKIAAVQKEAKRALGITSKARILPAATRLQIFNHVVKLYSQPTNNEPVKIIAQTNNNEPVEIVSQDKTPAPPEPENTKQAPVNIIAQPEDNEPVNIISHLGNFDNVRVAFYVDRNGNRERQVISLDGFFINALASIKVLKQDIPQWTQTQIDDWAAFDSKLPITRQIKYLIMLAVVKGLGGDDSVFYNE